MKISVFIKRNIRLFLKNRDYITEILGDIKSVKAKEEVLKKSEKARSSNEGDTFAIE